MMTWVRMAAAAAALVFGALAETPGGKIGVSVTGLEVAVAFWAPNELPKLDSVVIPGHVFQHGDKFDYQDIHLQDVTMTGSNVVTTDGSDGARGLLEVSLSGVGVQVPDFAFGVHEYVAGIHVHCHGVMRAQISDTVLVLAASATNVNGKPDVKVTGQAHVGRIDVAHRMNIVECRVAESVVELFIGDINKKISKAITQQLTPAISNIMGPLVEKELLQLAYTQEIYPGVTVDYSLVGPIAITAKGLELGVRGQFRATQNPMPPTYHPVSLPDVDFDREAQVILAESVINEASTQLAVKVGHGNIKFGNTSSLPTALGVLANLLNSICQGCPFNVDFAILEAPTADITAASGMKVNLERAFVNLTLVDPVGRLVPLGTAELNATASAGIGLSAQGDFITAKYALEKFALFHTSVFGVITPPQLVQLVDYVVQAELLQYANEHWNMIPIPSVPNTSFRNAVATEQDGFLVVKADVVFFQDNLL